MIMGYAKLTAALRCSICCHCQLWVATRGLVHRVVQEMIDWAFSIRVWMRQKLMNREWGSPSQKKKWGMSWVQYNHVSRWVFGIFAIFVRRLVNFGVAYL